MKRIEIQNILQKMGKTVTNKVNTIKSEQYNEKYGTLADKFFEYSKRVLQLEGIEAPDNQPEPTETDLLLAKSIVNDVKGNGWEGSGQGMMKFFSLVLGRNLESKAVGMECRLELPKLCFVKRNNGTIGMISENGNLVKQDGERLQKDTSFNKSNQDISLPTKEEILIYVGKIFESSALTRNFSSFFKVSTMEEAMDLVSISQNGIDMENYDQYEYKNFMVNINPNITQGQPLMGVAV